MWVNRKRFEALEERVGCLSRLICVAARGGRTPTENLMTELFEFDGDDALRGAIQGASIMRTDNGKAVFVADVLKALIKAHGNKLEWQEGTPGKVVIK